ncbi:ABC transporter ATP-binding protein [Pseudorhodobacter sp.]|uniref:ABC transporter ATP-binding protein n=1 Tax=Pseudorhodobacter sp. TaxID=1934400 RepID=UPI00264948E9|nr:ABC transporter ATP-binding protein [Pseudorhodobacter sp.]MDN5786575.1 ABC transporter ATP-binding protein [Pseudorhodobacter sp.]
MAEAFPGVVLGADRLSKAYGPVQANRDISLLLGSGEIHAVVGENGAGKSTLMRMLQGMEQPDSGSVILDGAPVRLSGPAEAMARGIGMVHQEFMLAPDLSLLQNLVLGAEPLKPGPLRRVDWVSARREGVALADRIGVVVDWDCPSAAAPVHIQQFTEIIRLLRRGAKILILDEPTAVLAPPQVEELFTLLRRLRAEGASILFISHKIPEVTALADRVSVIRRGQVVFSAAMADTSGDEIAGHIVGDHSAPVAAPKPAPGSITPHTVLAMEAVSTSAATRALRDVSLHVSAGEIVGLAGVAGNGQGELAEVLAGLHRVNTGRITLNDKDITAQDNATRRGAGIGYISADRRHEGLCLPATIATNTMTGSHRAPPVASGWRLRPRALAKAAEARLQALQVRYGRLSDPVSSLSGGNQQKLVFAREIAPKPDFLIVSQPTRGVDLNGIAAIHSLLRDFRNQGGAALLVSEELDEIMALSDRILVMAEGRIVGEVPKGASAQEIGRMMIMGGHHG